MKTTTTNSSPTTAIRSAESLRGQTLAAGMSTALTGGAMSLATYALARLAGADFLMSTDGVRLMEVGPLHIVTTILIAVLVGTAALALAMRRGRRAVSVLAWFGLAVGIVSTLGPLTLQGSTGARGSLAAMHVIVGAVWWFVLRGQLAGNRRKP